MRRQRAFTLVLVACCLLVLTSLSASMESTVSSTPDDAIDLDYGSLPLTVEDAAELRETYETGQPDPDGDSSESSQSPPQSPSQSESDRLDQNPSGTEDVESGGADAERVGSSESETEDEGGAGDREQGLIERLLELLATLLAALPMVLLLAGTALAVHQRNRLLAWLRDRLGGDRSTEGESASADSSMLTFRPPTNRVEQAWLEMLSASDVDPDPSATPRECAEELVRSGFDSDAVWELTAMFEEVRYDDAPVTATQVQEALRCLRRSTRREVAG